MNLRSLLGPEHYSVPMTVLVVAVILALLATILVMARRRQTYASAPLSLLAVGYGGVALATAFSMWTMLRVLGEMAESGGGIASYSFGVWQAMRMPLAAAWIAAAATLLALVLAARSMRDERPAAHAKSVWWIGGLAVLAGVMPLIAFRGAVAFILDIMRPGYQPSWMIRRLTMVEVTYGSFAGAGLAGAVCFLIALALAVRILRHGAAPRRMVVAMLVVSLVASAVLITELRAYSSRWQGIATGRQPIESRISSIVLRRHVYIGVSRTVNFDDSVSRSSCTRSRNSSAVSDSKATTKS